MKLTHLPLSHDIFTDSLKLTCNYPLSQLTRKRKISCIHLMPYADAFNVIKSLVFSIN